MKKLDTISIDPPKDFDDEKIKKKLKEMRYRISELQHLLFGNKKRSLLVVLQGMDASGKDGTIKNVFGRIPPFGINVQSFKVPSKEELSHDFLWRVHKKVPAKGMVTIFNRSHYEDVLVTRVLGYTNDETAKERFQLINNFERQLAHNGTVILKFYLHISFEEQEKRLLERTMIQRKFYKHSDGDWEMREHWEDFMKYYKECIENTQEVAPWHIIPVGNKRYKEYLVAQKVIEALEGLEERYPALDSERF